MSDTKKTQKPINAFEKGSLNAKSDEEKKFIWRQRVEHFFSESKQQYLELKREGKIHSYAALAILFAFSVGVISQSSQQINEVMASLFSFIK